MSKILCGSHLRRFYYTYKFIIRKEMANFSFLCMFINMCLVHTIYIYYKWRVFMVFASPLGNNFPSIYIMARMYYAQYIYCIYFVRILFAL